MAVVYLGLGTNLGEKERNLREAVQKIEEQIGNVVSLSAFYVTAPWGFHSDNWARISERRNEISGRLCRK